MKSNLPRQWLPLIGYAFITFVAVLSSIHVEDMLYRILLIISAAVSLVLTITDFISSRKMWKTINEIGHKQLSVDVDGETVVISSNNEKA